MYQVLRTNLSNDATPVLEMHLLGKGRKRGPVLHVSSVTTQLYMHTTLAHQAQQFSLFFNLFSLVSQTDWQALCT